jgi:two-component system CheB/CheR fusion protein
MRLRDTQDPLVQRAREVAERQVRHQTRMVNDLLDVSRVTLGKIVLQPEPLPLRAAAEHALQPLRKAAEDRGVDLVIEGMDTVIVEGDPTRIEQVIANLVQNAIKYTSPGGRICLVIQQEGEEAVLRVQDNGAGIAPELLPRIFDLFAQAPATPDRAGAGLGLGLTLVRRLVEMHGGTVSAHSGGLGQGSEFIVRWPAGDGGRRRVPLPQRAALLPAPHPPPRSGRRVLVIEDNPDAADTLRELLEQFGYEVAVASTGPSGLAAARQTRPAVILCDIGLPGMDGYHIAAELRQEASTASIRLIAVSGYGQEDDLRRSREAGFETHLTKPVDPSELQRLLAGSQEQV